VASEIRGHSALHIQQEKLRIKRATTKVPLPEVTRKT